MKDAGSSEPLAHLPHSHTRGDPAGLVDLMRSLIHVLCRWPIALRSDLATVSVLDNLSRLHPRLRLSHRVTCTGFEDGGRAEAVVIVQVDDVASLAES